MKTIEICGKKYEIDCNALTYVKYKTFFEKGILEDIQTIQEYLVRQAVAVQQAEDQKMSEEEQVAFLNEAMKKYIDEYIVVVTRIAWILIYTADKKVVEYEEWLESLEKFKVDDDWIVEVTEFAVNCFC